MGNTVGLYRNRTAKTNGYERLGSIKLGDKRELMTNSTEEAQCPFCRSSNLTYKNVMRYYKCNTCENTFINPVYSYGEAKERRLEVEPRKSLAQEISGQPKLESKNEKEPNMDIARKPRPTKRGWLILLFVFTVIISIIVVVWDALGVQIEVY
jgi:ribosomal protein L37AE/L43A